MLANSAYIAPSDGFFIIIQIKAQSSGAAYELTINGTEVANGPASAVKGDQSPLFPVKKGDRIVSTKAFSTGNAYSNAYFIPAR